MKQILFMVPNCGGCAYVRDWLERTDTLQHVEQQFVYTREGRVTQLAAAHHVYDGPILLVLDDHGREVQRLMGPRHITPAVVLQHAKG